MQLLRPRWKSLYEARKVHRNEASPLPDLPDTFFGWIPMIWRITEQQVLASAGLDAYVVSTRSNPDYIVSTDQMPVPALLQARLQVPSRHPLLLARGVQASP